MDPKRVALDAFRKMVKENRSILVDRYLEMWEENVDGKVNDLWLYPPAGELYYCDAGVREMGKNRYWNRLPYDRNRVIVRDCPQGDYINASHMENIPNCSKCIAAQGPMEGTVDTFWRMIVQNDINLIVMLTEKNCHRYWPGLVGGTSRFCDLINIQLSDEQKSTCGGHTIRTFTVTVDGVPGDRKIVHVQFHGWPDFGAPDDPGLLVSFIKVVMDVTAKLRDEFYDLPDRLIHCTGGNGRTGTFLLLELLIRYYEQNNTIWKDPILIIKRLRHSRMAMVETDDQLLYACDAFIEYTQQSAS